MGLDIYVYKPVGFTDQNEAQANYDDINGCLTFFNVDENPELVKYDKFIYSISVEEYNLNEIYNKYNFEEDDLIMSSDEFENFDTPDEKYFLIWTLTDGRVLKIEENTLPTSTKDCKMIAFEKVAYQRKGANAAFYKDGMWDSSLVTDKTTLIDHWNKYFSGDVKKEKKELKPGFLTGLGTEYDLDAKENRENFKNNIIDKFIDGETMVGYL